MEKASEHCILNMLIAFCHEAQILSEAVCIEKRSTPSYPEKHVWCIRLRGVSGNLYRPMHNCSIDWERFLTSVPTKKMCAAAMETKDVSPFALAPVDPIMNQRYL